MGGRVVEAFPQHRSRSWEDDELPVASYRRQRTSRRSRSLLTRRNVWLAKWLSQRWLQQTLAAALLLVLVGIGLKLPFGLGEQLRQGMAAVLTEDMNTERAAAGLRELAREGRNWMAAQLAGNGFGPDADRDHSALPVAGNGRLDGGALDSLLWPAGNDVISSFGWRSSAAGEDQFHPGIDLRAAAHSPVVAAAPGIVRRVWTEDEGYGLTVELEHADGWTTRYGRLGSVYVAAGDQVEQGQVIASVGLPGTGDQSHLHFELRHEGQEVDPEPKLRRQESGLR